MKIYGKILIGILFIYAGLISFLLFLGSKKIDISKDKNLNRASGWVNSQSSYSGSELSFAIRNSPQIEFEFSSESNANQGLQIYVDQKYYYVSSPNLDTQKLSIVLDKKKTHSITVRHVCTRFYSPCQVKIRGIYVVPGTQVYPFTSHKKVLSILGDSISTIYGKDNYSQLLADDLGYELHNASILESTVTDTKGGNGAIKRYKKDVLGTKSDATIIFLGTNDAARGVDVKVFENDYSAIVKDIVSYNARGKVYLVGSLPRNDVNESLLENYNLIIKRIAQKYNVRYIDPDSWLLSGDFSDGLHPAFESQRKLANQFRDILNRDIK